MKKIGKVKKIGKAMKDGYDRKAKHPNNTVFIYRRQETKEC